jgi:hypothetical protein
MTVFQVGGNVHLLELDQLSSLVLSKEMQKPGQSERAGSASLDQLQGGAGL